MQNAVRENLTILALVILLVPAARAGDHVKFNYQGRVLVDGAPYNGPGSLKVAIVNTTGTITVWSNDGTSTGGSEPDASIPVNAANGVFDVMVGDTALGMQPIHGVLFNDRDDLRLRVWFNDGTHGFQLLTPDREIPNARMLGLREATEPLTIYVNGTTGNNADSGLAPNQAKKTIQAAVDMAPKFMRAMVTIDIADGIYTETVYVEGFQGGSRGQLSIVGDENTTANRTTDLLVRISGNEGYGIVVTSASGVSINGIQADNNAASGILVKQSDVSFTNCKSTLNGVNGFDFWRSLSLAMNGCWSVGNHSFGIRVNSVSELSMTDCGSVNNYYTGVDLVRKSCVKMYGSGTYSDNQTGFYVAHASYLEFRSTYSGLIQNNVEYGIRVRWDSHTQDAALRNTITGNGSGAIETLYGGATY